MTFNTNAPGIPGAFYLTETGAKQKTPYMDKGRTARADHGMK